jgi:hypothetical protein
MIVNYDAVMRDGLADHCWGTATALFFRERILTQPL